MNTEMGESNRAPGAIHSVVIRTPRLCLRNFEPGDVEVFVASLTDPEAMGGPDGTRTEQQAKQELEEYLAHHRQHGFAPFAVLHEGQVVGDVGLQRLEGGEEVELRYRLLPSVGGQGFATEACDAALEYAFSDLGLDEVIAVISDDNASSQRVAERLGFERGASGIYYEQPLVRYRVTPELHARAVAAREDQRRE
jgi:RimJ/RimL family protein N-acetyltransferase